MLLDVHGIVKGGVLSFNGITSLLCFSSSR